VELFSEIMGLYVVPKAVEGADGEIGMRRCGTRYPVEVSRPLGHIDVAEAVAVEAALEVMNGTTVRPSLEVWLAICTVVVLVGFAESSVEEGNRNTAIMRVQVIREQVITSIRSWTRSWACIPVLASIMKQEVVICQCEICGGWDARGALKLLVAEVDEAGMPARVRELLRSRDRNTV